MNDFLKILKALARRLGISGSAVSQHLKVLQKAGLITGVALVGLGFIFTHSTLLTRATEFAQKARGAAMSLVATCFMGGGGIGTGIGGRLIVRFGLESLFIIYGVALVITLLISFVLIRDKVVEEDESREEVDHL